MKAPFTQPLTKKCSISISLETSVVVLPSFLTIFSRLSRTKATCPRVQGCGRAGGAGLTSGAGAGAGSDVLVAGRRRGGILAGAGGLGFLMGASPVFLVGAVAFLGAVLVAMVCSFKYQRWYHYTLQE